MATINVTADINWEAITGKTAGGGDTFAISNGATLTMDTDTRYCTNSASDCGTFSFDANTGGVLKVDGTGVRIIPYNTGSGNVPAIGTTITQGGVTSYLLGVWSAINTTPTAAAAAMPASGFIKVKNKSGGNYAAGALTGIGATATGADKVGWILVLARAAQTVAAPLTGKLETRGAWFDLGTTNGSRGQTIQLPYLSGTLPVPGVWIETSPGSGTFEMYHTASGIVASTTPTSAARGKVVWISTSTGVVTIGNDGTNNVGYLPASGCAIRIPNVFLMTATATPAIEASYSGHASNQMQYSGKLDMEYVVTTWGLTPSGISRMLYAASAVTIAFAGGNLYFRDTHVAAAGGAANQAVFSGTSTATNRTVLDWDGVTCFTRLATAPPFSATGLSGAAYNSRFICAAAASANKRQACRIGQYSSDLLFQNTTVIGGGIGPNTTDSGEITRVTIKDTVFGYTFSGATGVTYTHIFATVSNNKNNADLVFDGLTYLSGETNVHPYSSFIAADGSNNLTVRNIGTAAAPLSAGSANPATYLLNAAPANLYGKVRFQRIYLTGLATGLVSMSSNSGGVDTRFDNVFGTFAHGLVPRGNGIAFRSVGATITKTATTSADNFFHSFFSSTTTGSILLCFNNPLYTTSVTSTPVGTARFTGSGTISMPTIGDQIEWTMPWYAKGHTSFQNAAPVLTSGTASNFTIEYKIDRNDGAGFSASWATMSGANLSAETISAVNGFKLKIRITTAVTNTEAPSFLEILTNTDATSQHELYPLEEYTVTLSGLVSGSDIVIRSAGTSTILSSVDSNSGSSWSYTYEAPHAVDVDVIKPGYVVLPLLRNFTLPSSNSTLPVSQIVDRNYS